MPFLIRPSRHFRLHSAIDKIPETALRPVKSFTLRVYAALTRHWQ